MAELPDDLQKCVADQAEARVRFEVQGYAKYLTPEAVDSLRASFPGIPPRVNRFEVDGSEAEGSAHVVNVRYFQRDDSFVVRSKWEQMDGEWKVTHAERIWEEGQKRPGILSRAVGKIIGWLSRNKPSG